MKKFLVLLLGALMVLGFATASFAIHEEASQIEAGAAVAEPGTAFVFGGDARVRGYMNKDYDFNSDSDLGEVQRYDSRARFTVDAKTAGGIELRTRMTLGDAGNNYMWGETNTKSVYWDWAYIHAPLGFVPITVDAGNQRANWAYKFFVWDSPADRLKFSGTFNNVKISVGTDKVSEATGDNVDPDGDQVGGDYDKYFATVGTNFGDWAVNLLYINYQDGRPLATDSDCVGADGIAGTADDGICNNTGADADGNTWDLWVTGKIGPVGAHLEYVTRNGDLFEDPNDDESPNGAYLAFDFATGQWVVFGAYAYTRNGYVADNDFAPTLLFGSVQATAIMEFGQFGGFGTADTDAVVVGGVFNLNEALSFSARYANAQLDPFFINASAGIDVTGDGIPDSFFCDGDCDEGTIQEIDVQADYKISKNLTYTLAYGSASLSGDLFDGADDPSTLINMLNYKF